MGPVSIYQSATHLNIVNSVIATEGRRQITPGIEPAAVPIQRLNGLLGSNRLLAVASCSEPSGTHRSPIVPNPAAPNWKLFFADPRNECGFTPTSGGSARWH